MARPVLIAVITASAQTQKWCSLISAQIDTGAPAGNVFGYLMTALAVFAYFEILIVNRLLHV
jgi:hypothetical protein